MSAEDLVKRIYELPSIPKVVQDLIQNFSSNSADAQTISKNIQADPVIAAKVLRLANSVRYGAGRKVASLDSAVVMLGSDALKTLVIASGVTGTMKDIPGMEMREFWRNSFMVANICKLIARNASDCNPETAFTCGMLHNIGIPLMTLVHSDDMAAIQLQVEEGAVRSEVERTRFGFDTNEVGARLAEAWKFPEEIVDALASQGRPLNTPGLSPYAAIIQLAEYLNARFDDGVDAQTMISEMPEGFLSVLTINTFKLFEELQKLSESEDDIDELLAA